MKKTARIVSMFLTKDPGHGRVRSRLLILPFTVLLLLSSQSFSFAGSATWQLNPTTGDWNTAANWMPNTVPNRSSDTATFNFSNITDVALSADTEVSGMVFNAGASAFTITTGPHFTLTISGVGIQNNSGIAQNFVAAADLPYDREILFVNGATAGNAIFTIARARVDFLGHSRADNATFILNNGTGTNASGGSLVFLEGSTAGNATLIAYSSQDGARGPIIAFVQHSHGGNARVKFVGNGNFGSGDESSAFLDISGNTAPSVTIGSIEGSGRITLGRKTLAVGSNNRNTFFSGVISEGGISGGGGPGSLTKIGTGKLVLRHANTYSGGTTIYRGRLLVNNIGGSGTGSGPVEVEGGKLGGKGMIAGAVTVGTGSGAGAVLAPGYLHGAGRPGALTIQSPLTFNSDGIYQMELDSSNVTADEVIATGVTINAGAQFSFLDFGSASLPPGTVFTAIHNTSANPIAGAFANLPDGSTFISNGNTFKVNYKGGDGNDLTLTIMR